MAKYNLILPRMGESVSEATIIKWIKHPGDAIEIDDAVVDIATDKVDSEVPSPVAGKLLQQLVNENDTAQVGDRIAIIEIEGEDLEEPAQPIEEEKIIITKIPGTELLETKEEERVTDTHVLTRFYSPLVKSIAAE